MSGESCRSFVSIFREAAPYIERHRGRTFVITITGADTSSSSSSTAARFETILSDVALLHALGVKLVLVLGCGERIDAILRARGAEPRFEEAAVDVDTVAGNDSEKKMMLVRDRVTDELALMAAKEAAGEVSVRVAAGLNREASLPLVRRHGRERKHARVVSGNFTDAQRIGVVRGVDYMHTGRVRGIDKESIEQQLDAGNIVALSNLGYSPAGEVLNCQVYDVAAAASASLGADKAVFLAPGVDGVVDETHIGDGEDASAAANGSGGGGGSSNGSGSGGGLIRWLTLPKAESIRRERSAQRGRDSACFEALSAAVGVCNAGVNRAHIVNSAVPGALLLELYTLDGIGTMVSADMYEGTRRARLGDVDAIHTLLQPLAAQGVLAKRDRASLIAAVHDFYVVERDGSVIACASLSRHDVNKMELGAFTVQSDYRNEGRGDALLVYVEQEARSAMGGAGEVFLLTTNTSEWFEERGYTRVVSESDVATVLQSSERRAKQIDPDRMSFVYRKHL